MVEAHCISFMCKHMQYLELKIDQQVYALRNGTLSVVCVCVRGGGGRVAVCVCVCVCVKLMTNPSSYLFWIDNPLRFSLDTFRTSDVSKVVLC